jgi:hypothetical protein
LLFIASTDIIIGDGNGTQFWHSHWLQGTPLKMQFLALFKHSSGSKLTVQAAFIDSKWIRCIKLNPSIAVLTEYLSVKPARHCQPNCWPT